MEKQVLRKRKRGFFAILTALLIAVQCLVPLASAATIPIHLHTEGEGMGAVLCVDDGYTTGYVKAGDIFNATGVEGVGYKIQYVNSEEGYTNNTTAIRTYTDDDKTYNYYSYKANVVSGTGGEVIYVLTPKTLTVSYNLGEGAGTVAAIPDQTLYTDTGYTNPTPTWEGHSLEGWYTNNDFTKAFTATTIDETFRSAADALTLYANWNENPHMTVEYYNSASGTRTLQTSEKIYGSGNYIAQASPSSLDPDSDLYILASWKHGENTINPGVAPNDVNDCNPDDVVQYDAVLTEKNIVFFHTNGGSLTGATVKTENSEYYKAYENTADISLETFAPTQAGKEFEGWYDNNDLTGDQKTSIPAGATGHKEFWAKWTENAPATQYTITFVTGGGTEIAPITGAAGTAVTAPANPTRDGYTFSGWDTEIPSTMPAENVTITALWTANNNNNNGGNGGGYTPVITPSAPTAPTTNNNTTEEKPEEKPAPTPFDGVKSAADGDKVKIDLSTSDSKVLPQDILSQIKGKDVTVEIQVADGITWTINGKDIDKLVGDIDLAITLGSTDIPVDVLNMLTGDKFSITLTIAFDGEFGFTATLTVNLKPENAGLYANLFYYDPDTEELEFVSYGIVDADGNVPFTFTHASAYTIILDDHPLDGSYAEEDAIEDDTDDEDDSAVDADVDPTDSNPGTGAATAFGMALLSAAAMLVSRKKRK